MLRKVFAISNKALILSVVCSFASVNVFCIDYGEWIELGNGIATSKNVNQWINFRKSSVAYSVKSGLMVGEKPDGNIVVSKIKSRKGGEEKKIVVRSSMYPFGQIKRAYDSIDLADILLGEITSKKMKNIVCIYNKLCFLQNAINKAKKTKEADAVLLTKNDLLNHASVINEYVGTQLINDISGITEEKLNVNGLKEYVRDLEGQILLLLKDYIKKLKEYFSMIGNSFSAFENEASIAIKHLEEISEKVTYEGINKELKNSKRFLNNAHRLVHSEDILLFYVMKNFPNYRPVLICTYLNMCKDCEQVVCSFANIKNGGDTLAVISEIEDPKEKEENRSTPKSLVKKINIKKI